MKVGDYVRFKDKRGNTYIRKVIDGYREHWYGCKIDKNANNVPYVSQKNIIKSSPNIIDLIEIGDYVNGKKVEWIGYGMYQDTEDGLIGVGDKFILFNEFTRDGAREKDIKSIVTKEQFSQIEYKL